LVIRNELQEALEQNQFRLFYQPLLNRDGLQLKGLEALIRWQHPLRGMVSPAEFIPTSEHTGQIFPVSQWVLRQACRDAVTLQSLGLEQCAIAINISPLQFKRAEFLPQLLETLSEFDLRSDAITLEITEGLLLDDSAAAIATLTALRQAGINVAIDDFGTGFSSLSYLKNLPVTELKIDRTFVQDVTANAQDAAITHSIIEMAHSLNLRVVAEGVETREQFEWLMTEGCDVMQGYYFARPMAFSDLNAYINALKA
ncbi:MAG: EAL domain-containing protein, partial [Natronospirillum sp.]